MLVIIHGWSDNARSFVRLGHHLVQQGIAPAVAHVKLGDYVSLDDDVTFFDLSQALQKAWLAQKLPTTPRSVDVVVHSTGGLVIRDWMTSHFAPDTNPVRRLLMLAPANFGSPLAHKGRSFIGRVIKGFKSDKFLQTGTHILKGLELASPYTWDLAGRDRFDPKAEWYGRGRVLCTVLVGTSGYSGISAAANEDGSDGTVRVSTANLNPLKVTLDFVADPQTPVLKVSQARGRTAFARIRGENHSTIAFKDGGPKHPRTAEFVARALTVNDQGFEAWADTLDAFSESERQATAADTFQQAYTNVVTRLSDSAGDEVSDYFIEAFAKVPREGVLPAQWSVDQRVTRLLQEEVLATVHVYGDRKAFRSLLFNATVLERDVSGAGKELYLSATALPDIRKTKSVGYRTFGWDDIGSLRLTPTRIRAVFPPDRTALVDLRIRREQEDGVFVLKPLA